MKSLQEYYDEIWDNIVREIREKNIYPDYIFDALFEEAQLTSINEKEHAIYITFHSSFKKMLFEPELVKEAPEVNLSEVINSCSFFNKQEEPYDIRTILIGEDEDGNEIKTVTPETNGDFDNTISPDYTFDNFVVGSSNKQAQLAALSCAHNPGMLYNPLFIYGDSGLGKTHLLHAIGNHIKKEYPEKRVLYLPTYELIDSYVNSTKKGKEKDNETTSKLAEKLKSVDVLLLDDVQFLSGKTKSNDFFFQIYNSLVNNRNQIVLTSDKSPSELNNFDIEERLVSRFASGLTVTVTSPEFTTRLEILRMKVQSQNMLGENMNIDDNTLAYIAANCKGDVRQLEGALTQLLFNQIQFPDLSDESILQDVLKTNIEMENKDPSTIIRAVCDYYHITKNQIMSKNRSSSIVTARHMAMYLCRKNLDLPFKKIAANFNGCDHTTVMNACTKMEKRVKSDPIFQQAVNAIENNL